VDSKAYRVGSRDIAQFQMDSALLLEGMTNALKVLRDQYLARVYRVVSERFHLAEWDASILRKLHTLKSIYEKMSDQAASHRMEILEWIIFRKEQEHLFSARRA
jgi:flagellar motility protein MotE (MotC chaperone)